MRGRFNRRFSRRGGMRASKFEKRKVAWDTTLFDSNVPVAATLAELVVFQPADVTPTAGAGNARVTLRRIVIDGGFTFEPLEAAAQFDHAGLIWALYTIDQEDTDASLATTIAGSIFATERILQAGMFELGIRERAGELTSIPEAITRSHHLHIDIAPIVNIRFDDILVLGVQFNTSVATTLATARGTFLTRVLYDRS